MAFQRNQPGLVEHLGLADHLVEAAVAELRHDLADLFGDEEEIVDHVLGLAGESVLSTGSCVATPTGQVLRWHLRIMMQPAAINGAVAKPNSSAPKSAPITTSRPVREAAIDLHHDAAAQPLAHQRLVGFGQTDFPWRPGSARSGQRRGTGAALKTAIVTWSARASATPAATVPTPTSETSLTETRPSGLTFFRNGRRSCARSSIE